MTEVQTLLSMLDSLLGLLATLVAKAPDKESTRREIAARLRRQLERHGLLDAVQAEDQAILDKRVPR